LKVLKAGKLALPNLVFNFSIHPDKPGDVPFCTITPKEFL